MLPEQRLLPRARMFHWITQLHNFSAFDFIHLFHLEVLTGSKSTEDIVGNGYAPVKSTNESENPVWCFPSTGTIGGSEVHTLRIESKGSQWKQKYREAHTPLVKTI